MRSTTWVVMASIVTLGACSVAISATAGEKEEKTTIDKVPAAVRATIEKAITGDQVKEIEKKQDEGKVIYEIDYVKDATEKSIQVNPDGMIVKTEETMSIDKVPAVVKAAIEKAMAMIGSKVKKIEKEQYAGKVVYDVDYVQEGEIIIAEDGTIVMSPKKDDDK